MKNMLQYEKMEALKEILLNYYGYSEEELDEVIKNNPCIIDKEALIRDIILNDGRGHIISSYDSIEHEACIDDRWYFIYKMN